MIRAATVGDCAVLADLARQVDEEHARIRPDYFRVPAHGPSRTRDEFLRDLQDAGTGVLIADVEQQPVGFVQVQLYDTPDRPTLAPHRRAHVDELVVDRAHRGRGAGTALIDAAAAWARARGAEELVLTVWVGNDAGERFYRNRGWKPLSTVLHKQL